MFTPEAYKVAAEEITSLIREGYHLVTYADFRCEGFYFAKLKHCRNGNVMQLSVTEKQLLQWKNGRLLKQTNFK